MQSGTRERFSQLLKDFGRFEKSRDGEEGQTCCGIMEIGLHVYCLKAVLPFHSPPQCPSAKLDLNETYTLF